MIVVKEITRRSDLLRFIKFPFKLYKDNPYWVPPIIREELRGFSKNNPIFKASQMRLFLAYQDEKIVGRVAAIISKGETKIRFGWFDFIDDIEVSRALLQKVSEWGAQNGLDYMEGPEGFTNMDKAGMLTEGFDQVATMIGLYNYAYYPKHLEQLGFRESAQWLEYKFKVRGVDISETIRVSKLIEERYGISSLNFRTNKEVLPYVDKMFDLLNITYKDLQSFVPIQKFQVEHYKKRYLPLVNPEFISCVIDNASQKLIAFSVVIPSLSSAFQKAKGRLFPFGFLHLMKALKSSRNAEFYLIGIHPDYQNKGVTSLIFREFQKSFAKHKIEWVETNPILEENIKTQLLWKSFSPEIHKRRQTFRKEL